LSDEKDLNIDDDVESPLFLTTLSQALVGLKVFIYLQNCICEQLEIRGKFFSTHNIVENFTDIQ
jgi:hypothetical protein